MDQYNTLSPRTHHANITDNIDSNNDESNNYPMTPTSSDDNNTGIDTNDLIMQLENLTNELELERANNEALTSNFSIYQSEQNDITANLKSTIENLQNELQSIKANTPTKNSNTDQTAADLHTDSKQTHAHDKPKSANKLPPPPAFPQQSTIDPTLFALIQQQQQIMTKHMEQNNRILAEFGKGIDSLRDATLKSAKAAEQQAAETIKARERKGPTNNRLPKFGAKSGENFADWYEDVLSILALKEWDGIYNTKTCSHHHHQEHRTT